MTRWRLALAPTVVILLGALACGSPEQRQPSALALDGAPARVGNIVIPASLVTDVARSRGEGERLALEQLVQDALLAQAGRAAGLDRTPDVTWGATRALARLVAERLHEEARALGAPTDEELATVRVIQAVVRRPSGGLSPKYRAVAEAIAQAVAGARDDAEFEALAKQVPHASAQVFVERLPAFDVAGRTTEGPEPAPAFVAAAFALHAPGALSPVVETEVGWHVIRLVDRVAPGGPSLESLREDLARAAEGARVRSRLDALLREERGRERVEISVGATALMAEAAAIVR